MINASELRHSRDSERWSLRFRPGNGFSNEAITSPSPRRGQACECSLYLAEEVAAFVIYDDEGREILNLYFPNGFHAQFRVIEHFY